MDGRELAAGNVIVATGSRAARPPIPGADLPHVVDSSGALQLQELPARVVIVGGGYIGMEFACYFHAVGCEVVVAEMLDDILTGVDADIVRQLKSALPGVAPGTSGRAYRRSTRPAWLSSPLAANGGRRLTWYCWRPGGRPIPAAWGWRRWGRCSTAAA